MDQEFGKPKIESPRIHLNGKAGAGPRGIYLFIVLLLMSPSIQSQTGSQRNWTEPDTDTITRVLPASTGTGESCIDDFISPPFERAAAE